MHSRCVSVAQHIRMMLVNTNECDTIRERREKKRMYRRRLCVQGLMRCISISVGKANCTHFSSHILFKLPYMCNVYVLAPISSNNYSMEI